MPAKHILTSALLALVILVAVACQPQAPTNGKKTIVVTYSILGSIVKEMVGDRANVIVSTPNGLDPHDWEPSARDIEAINKADLVVENGLGLEGGMEKTLQVARNNGVKFFTAADHITVRHVGPGEGIPTGDPDQVVGAPDPHLWTDPLTLKSVVNALGPALKNDLNLDVTVQSDNMSQRLDSLNTEIITIVAQVPEADRKLVTGHESMGYFAQRYRFKLVGVIIPSLSSQAGASAAALAAVEKAIKANHVKAVFSELGTSPAVAQAITNETGVKVVQLSTHALPPDGSYFTFMRNLATVITDALK